MKDNIFVDVSFVLKFCYIFVKLVFGVWFVSCSRVFIVCIVLFYEVLFFKNVKKNKKFEGGFFFVVKCVILFMVLIKCYCFKVFWIKLIRIFL